MATVIDALVITLGLDPTKFTEGQREALAAFKKTQESSTRTAKEMELRGKQAAQFFSKIRNEIIAFSAALIGATGLEQFIVRMTRADAAAGRTSKNLGVNVQDMTAWQHAAERMGGSADATKGSLQGIVTEFERMKLYGDSAMLQPLAQAGVDIQQFLDPAKNATEKLQLLADALKKVEQTQGRQKALFLGGQIGIDEATMNVMLDDWRKLIDLEKRHGTTTEADARAAIKLANAWHDLSRTFTDAGQKIMTALTPYLSELMEDLAKYVDVHKDEMVAWAKDLVEWIKKLVKEWPQTLQGIKDFISGADDAAQAVGGWVKIVEVLLGLWVGAKFAAMIAAIGMLPAAFGPVAAVVAGILASLYAIDKLTGGRLSKHAKELNDGLINSDQNDPTNDLIYQTRKEPREVGENASNPGTPRGIRNNNPLNLGYRADQPGVVGSDGRFGKYATMEDGIAAAQRQLSMYQEQSNRQKIPLTLERVITRWAPPSENDTAGYIAGVSKETGFKPNQVLDVNDPKISAALIHAMARREVGRDLDMATISRGVAAYPGGKGVTNAQRTSTINQETNIGQVTVNVPGGDADDVAKNTAAALKRNQFVPQANYGME